MKGAAKITFLLLSIMSALDSAEQTPYFNFHHVTPADGLCDGVVRAIGQDKYGYIWIATLSGLNRYNGYSVKRYQNIPGDTNTFPATTVRSIASDEAGNLWLGTSNGLYRFDFTSSSFHRVSSGERYTVLKIIPAGKDVFYLATSKGLARYYPATQKFYFFNTSDADCPLLSFPVNDMFLSRQSIYLAMDTGLVVFDINLQKPKLISLNPLINQNVSRVAVDGHGNVWLTFGFIGEKLLKVDSSYKKFELYNDFYYSAQNLRDNTIGNLFVDARKQLWIATTSQGIVLYDEIHNRFIPYTHDPLRPSSVGSNQFSQIFQDKEKFIWLGSEGYGVDYFHPDKNFLQVIAPSPTQEAVLPTFWARAITEDKDGYLWMAWGGALTRQKESDSSFSIWKNIKDEPSQLHYNSIRSLFCDDNGDVWVGTANGVNRLKHGSSKMQFFSEKDSLPESFYWCILQDSRKNIWFGYRSSFSYYDAVEKKIHSAASHPDLSPFKRYGVRCMIEDRRGRLWFGLNGAGLLLYDPAKHITRRWQRTETNDTTLMGNIVTSIAEDKKGIIWVSSFTGLVSYDSQKDKFTQYTQKNGLISLKTSCLMVDDHNRLWIGSTSGLLVLDSSRRYFKNLDMQDGLPTMEFNDQTAYKLKDGRFVFPSLKGFVVFNPNAYVEAFTPQPLYLAAVKVFNKELACQCNYETLDELKLRHNQNFFSIELAALNYANPQQMWYAYKLEPFDKDWIYTRDRIINYTNVPGGDYVFYYKASADPNTWKMPGKVLLISVGNVFYRTFWFWFMTVSLMSCLLYWLYRKRIEHKEKIYSLQNKAQALEKEKALVQYESLKQQLNPHFLFNSLTSLSSLIYINPQQADAFLENMSKIYRYILKNRDNELVSLEEEIRFVQTYIHLQKARFENGIVINMDVKKEQFPLRIVPVTLQNLIENAIKHNVIDEEHPLHIDIFSENGYLVLRNNLQKKNFVETSNKQGLVNLQSLYRYLSSRPIHIQEDEKYFTIKIPLINYERKT